MSKPTVHVLIPYTCEAACGTHGFSRITAVREQVTCRLCRKTDHYKNLKNAKKVKS